MSVRTRPCEPRRIAEFLDGRLSEFEQAALEEHLTDCPACRASLGTQTAGDELWDKASRYLRDGEGESEPFPGMSDSSPACDLSLSVQLVLDALGPTDDPEMLGRLGGYEVSGIVGTGGMGVVLKALDKSLERTVAIKVMAPHLASNGAARKRFAREAKAAAAVLHPNVMAIHSVSTGESLPYLVMPYMRGTSLQKRLDTEGPLPISEILRIASQTAAGLAAAHAQGIVHRDIKPANILLEQGVERVAITDFGLARAVDDASMTRTGVVAGTPQYMSPEQARGEPVDQRSDLFSLGSVLYAVCTGRAPFRAESSYGVLRRITDEEPRSIREINPEIPEWLCAIIAKLMSKSAGNRYQSAAEVSDLFETCLAHVQQPSVVPLPKSVAPRTAISAGRGRFGKLIALAAFAMLMFFAGILIVLELNKGKLKIECEADDVPVKIMRGEEVVKKLTVTRAGTSVRIAAGRYVVLIDGELNGIIVENGTVKLQRGGRDVVRIVHDTRGEVKRAQQAAAKSSEAADSETEGLAAGRHADSVALVMLMHPAEFVDGNRVQQSAASVALGQLLSSDYCGILKYSKETPSWLWGDDQGVVEIGERRADLLKAIAGSRTGDFPRFDPALRMAYQALSQVDATRRHMIILTNGDPDLSNDAILQAFREARITISVVHIELHGPRYVAVPKRIAEKTGGRYFHVLNAQPSVVEKLFLREATQLIQNRDEEVPKDGEGKKVPEVGGSAEPRAWQQSKSYIGPRFDRFFPDDADGGLALNKLWKSKDKDSRSDREILATVRKGLRRTSEHRTLILRWLGNKYIWNKPAQNPDAIEIMYHAADFSGAQADPYGTRHYAVYFGLSVVQPKSAAILRTLAELGMRVDDPNDLDRIAWGASNQRQELLRYLKPFHSSDDEAVREKAAVCGRIFRGELKAFAWAAEQARLRALKNYGEQLPQFKEVLSSGSSEDRGKTLKTILGQRISLIMDDSFVAAFAQCAQDADHRVRDQATVIAGARWVWEAEKQNAEAIELMLRLSTDVNRQVRYNAVYYGLSTVRNKSDEVVRRLLEMAFADREWNLFGRIKWGLSNDRERVAKMLNAYMNGPNEQHAAAAREIYRTMIGRDPAAASSKKTK